MLLLVTIVSDVHEGLEELLKDTEEDTTLRRQVRGVLTAVRKIKDTAASLPPVSHAQPLPLNTSAPPPAATPAAGNIKYPQYLQTSHRRCSEKIIQ